MQLSCVVCANKLFTEQEVTKIFEKHEGQARRALGVSSAAELMKRFDMVYESFLSWRLCVCSRFCDRMAHMGASTSFAQDSDGVLSPEEQIQLVRDLEAWATEAQLEKDKYEHMQGIVQLQDGQFQGKQVSLFMAAVKSDVHSFSKEILMMENMLNKVTLTRVAIPNNGNVTSGCCRS